MPAIYELLPRPRHGAVIDEATHQPVDILDPKVWEDRHWGLADPAQDGELRKLLPGVENADERRAIALDHQRKCLRRARQFFAALDVPARPPHGTSLYLMAGDAIGTSATVGVGPGGKLRVTATAPGDGSVPRTSALMDERVGGKWSPELRSPIAWEQVFFFFKGHLELTKDPRFVDNLLFILMEDPRH